MLEAARALGLQIQVLKASTSPREIEAAFAALVRDRADALFVAPGGFFSSRRVQLATLAAHYRVPAAYSLREFVETGGLMSYGTDLLDAWRQVGVYTGQILKGAKPADLPVMQSTKFEFVINLTTAKALGVEISDNLLSLAIVRFIVTRARRLLRAVSPFARFDYSRRCGGTAAIEGEADLSKPRQQRSD